MGAPRRPQTSAPSHQETEDQNPRPGCHENQQHKGRKRGERGQSPGRRVPGRRNGHAHPPPPPPPPPPPRRPSPERGEGGARRGPGKKGGNVPRPTHGRRREPVDTPDRDPATGAKGPAAGKNGTPARNRHEATGSRPDPPHPPGSREKTTEIGPRNSTGERELRSPSPQQII